MLYLRCLLVLAGLTTSVLGQTKSPDEAYNSTSSLKAAEAEEVYLFSINAWSFYKVSAQGQMTAENINRTCQAAGYVMPCPGLGICQNSACVATSLDDCLNPMLEVSTMICGTAPDKCPQLYGVYAYAGSPWPGNSCGAEPGQWCTKGTDFYNKHAFCAKENDDRTEDGFILVADSGLQAIFQINLTTGSEVELPLGSMSAPFALNYDPANDDVYWTDATEKKIMRGSRNGDNVEVLVEGNIVDGLALDLTAGNMFWTERETDVIAVARLDGRHQKVLFSTDLNEPRAIVLDPANGRMFWTDWGPGNQKIERASMDGTDRVTIVNTALGGPNGLTIDFNENRLYWCDCCTHTIESTDFLGRDRRLLVRYPPLHFFGVALDDGHIYATTWNVKRVVWTKRSAPLRYGLIGSTHKGLNGIIVHKTMQSPSLRSNITNACTVMNGGCQHLCLLRPGGRTCGCQKNWTLQDDDTTCQYKDNDDTMTTSTAWQLPVALSLAAIVLVAVCAVGSFVYWKKSRKRTKPEPVVNFDLTNVTFHPDLLDPERSASPVVAPDATPHGEPDTAPNNSSDASPNSEVANRLRFEEYELDRNILHLKREIGRGAFGIAFLAQMDGRPGDGKVVVKTVYEDATEEERVTFLREIKTTARLGKHVNLLGLLGCCSDGPSSLMVTEYMPYGDLKAFLLNCRQVRHTFYKQTYKVRCSNVGNRQEAHIYRHTRSTVVT
ncbi:uncharacterized protein [Branchiostoma lanceolatum]|uniref:uncharacterized protein n=1 Tax=Branchiostoma lanceolatum TaxID=7740 RepID=UPI0034520D51